MSADNAVVLLKTRGGEYRIAKLQGWMPSIHDSLADLQQQLPRFFGDSRVHRDAAAAMRAAIRLGNQIAAERTLEYGVRLVDLPVAFPK